MSAKKDKVKQRDVKRVEGLECKGRQKNCDRNYPKKME